MPGRADLALICTPGPTVPGVLRELGKPRHGKQLRRLARMLIRMMHVQPPEPMDFWENADDARRREAAERWRQKIREERPTRRD